MNPTSRILRSVQTLLSGLLVLGIGALSAHPADAAPPFFQVFLNPDGSGSLRVDVLDGSEPAWQVCSPDLSNCTPFATGTAISTDGAPADDVFWNGQLKSPIWHGNVSSQTPPSVSGVVRANELVTPIAGQWSGGWDGDFDVTQLGACANQAGQNCTALTDSEHLGGCRNGAVVLDPALAGDYLRVADQRFGPGAYFGPPGYGLPFGDKIWAPGPTVSVALAGRIAPATGPRENNCGPPPLTRATISTNGIARVRCTLGCRAALIVKRGQRRARLVRKLPAAFRLRPPTRLEKLQLSRSSLVRLGSGRARMIVEIDGKRAAQRTVLLDRPRRKA